MYRFTLESHRSIISQIKIGIFLIMPKLPHAKCTGNRVTVYYHQMKKQITFASPMLAEHFASDINFKMQSGTFNWNDIEMTVSPVFKSYSINWLNKYVRKNKRTQTYIAYKNAIVNHLLDEFGVKKLEEISHKNVRDFLLDKINSGINPRLIMATGRALYNYAIESDEARNNPFCHHSLLRDHMKSIPRNEMVLNEKEIHLLLITAKMRHPKLFPVVYTALSIGTRIGELLALKPTDFNFQSRYVRIEKQINIQGIESPLKTSQSHRQIDLNINYCEWIKRYINLFLDSEPISQYIFSDDKGKIISRRTITGWYDRCLLDSGIKIPYTFHDLRRTYLNNLLSVDRIDLDYVARQFGSTLSVIEKHYRKNRPKQNLEIADSVKIPAIGNFYDIKNIIG